MNYLCLIIISVFAQFFIPNYVMAVAPTIKWVAKSDVDIYDHVIDNAVDASGNAFVLGRTATNDPNITDTTLIKYNTNGKKIWDRRINLGDSETPVKLVLDSSGNPCMTVTSVNYTTNSIDFITVKFKANGRQLWINKFTVPNLGFNDRIVDMAIDPLDNLYVAGISWVDTGEPNGEMRYTTIKYDTNGNELWIRQYDHCGWNNSLASMAVDSSGNVYLTGNSFCGGLETVKYDTAGNLLWGELITNDIPKSLNAEKIKVDSSGNIYIVALESGNDFGGCKVVKLDGSGNELWRTTHDFSYYWWSSDLDAEIDVNGNVFAAINIRDYNTSTYNIMTLKFSNDGSVLWSRLYDTGPDDEPADLELDSTGNVYVAGWGDGYSRYNSILLKYNTNGTELWSEIYNTDLEDYGMALAIDSSSNVYVSGDFWNNDPTGSNLFTIKYICPQGGC